LASGSVDCTVRVWNLRTGGAFTLRGHSDWVNSVQLWDSGSSSAPRPSPLARESSSQIDPGKMLLSASDDGTIKLWDLNLRTCVRTFTGHVCQVQSMKLLLLDDCSDDDVAGEDSRTRGPAAAAPLPVSIPLEHPGYHALTSVSAEPPNDAVPERVASPAAAQLKQLKTLLISGSLDNTVKMWDIDTGKTVRTLFGHIEGVWAVAADKLRLVTGSHDRTIKVSPRSVRFS
jgi:F-box and WD-40 domain protein MET30